MALDHNITKMFEVLHYYIPTKSKKDVKFEIGIYKYVRSTIKDVRVIKTLEANNFENTFNKVFAKLKSDQEIAIQSKVRIRKK